MGGLSEASDNCTAPNSTATDLLVDSTSTSGTVADYNYAHTDETAMPTLYTWAGTAYTTPPRRSKRRRAGPHTIRASRSTRR